MQTVIYYNINLHISHDSTFEGENLLFKKQKLIEVIFQQLGLAEATSTERLRRSTLPGLCGVKLHLAMHFR